MENAVLPMAATAVAAGQLETAHRLYGRLLEIDPDSAAARMGLGDIALERQESRAATNWYLAALEHAQEPQQRQAALLAHGRAALAAGQLEAARESFTRLTDPEESAPSASVAWGHNGIGLTRLLEGDLRGAVVAMERAVLLDPEEARFQANLTRALTMLDRAPPSALSGNDGQAQVDKHRDDQSSASVTASFLEDANVATIGKLPGPSAGGSAEDQSDSPEPERGEKLSLVVDNVQTALESAVPHGSPPDPGSGESSVTGQAELVDPGEKAEQDQDAIKDHAETHADTDSTDEDGGQFDWETPDPPIYGEAVRDLLVDLASHGYEFDDWSMLEELANGSGSLPSILVLEDDQTFLQAGAYAERYVAETLAEELQELTERPVDVTVDLGRRRCDVAPSPDRPS